MTALILILGAIVITIIYFLGKAFLSIIEFILHILGKLMGSGWFWCLLTFIGFLLFMRKLAV